MFVPKSHGGLDVDVPASMEIIETLATADGSTGWVVMIGCETPMFLALLSRKHFDRPLCQWSRRDNRRRDSRLAGRPKWLTAAIASAGDGVSPADASIASGCSAIASSRKRERPRPGVIPGTPEARAMMFAPSKAQIIDTWSVNGLRGTGSHDIAVENLAVPADDSFDIFLGRSSIAGPSMAEPLPLRRAAYRRGRDRNCAARAHRDRRARQHQQAPASMRARRSPRVRCFSIEWDTRTRVCAPPATFCAARPTRYGIPRSQGIQFQSKAARR